MLHIHLSSGAGTIGVLVADLSSGLRLNPPHEDVYYFCQILAKFGCFYKPQQNSQMSNIIQTRWVVLELMHV
jgi:hypothetical protein